MSSILKKEHQTELQTDEQHQIETNSRYVGGKLQNETSSWLPRISLLDMARPSIFYIDI